MLELELVISNKSNVYLSLKTFFVENVLYNVPDKFYKSNDFCEIFRNVVNYLNQCELSDILIPGINKEMFEYDKYYANSNYDSFLKKIKYIYLNADNMISDALKQRDETNQQENTDNSDKDSLHSTEEKQVKKINKNVDDN